MNSATDVWVETPACHVCGNKSKVELTAVEFSAVESGALIQRALPSRPAAFRELFISGVHEHCWLKIFPDEEE